jgi:hypothetical protein
MFRKSMIKISLVAVASLVVAGIGAAGGNTIAMSGKTSTLSASTTRVLATGLGVLGDSGTDVCATIVNRSEKTAVIELTLTDVFAATSTSQISKAKSSALCLEENNSVSVTCLGPGKCAFTWSIDKF